MSSGVSGTGSAVSGFAKEVFGAGLAGGIGGRLAEDVNIVRNTTDAFSSLVNKVTDPITNVMQDAVRKIGQFAFKR